ncbi:MAG: hypothetical protein RL757_2130 [Bacteroidota bacterium]|jgi:hypothetical protein
MKQIKWIFFVSIIVLICGCAPKQLNYTCDGTTGGSCQHMWYFWSFAQTTHDMVAIKNYWQSKSIQIIDKTDKKNRDHHVDVILNDKDVQFVKFVLRTYKNHVSIFNVGICFKRPFTKSEAKVCLANIKEAFIAPIVK